MSRKVGWSVKKTGTSNTAKMLNSFAKLSENTVQAGHFAEQGEHPTAGMSYVDLMRLHASGKEYVVRDPLAVLRWLVRSIPTSVYGNNLRAFMTNPQDTGALTRIFDSLGGYLAEREKRIFGDTKYLSGDNGNISPLIDTGALVEAVSYKNSIDRKLKQ